MHILSHGDSLAVRDAHAMGAAVKGLILRVAQMAVRDLPALGTIGGGGGGGGANDTEAAPRPTPPHARTFVAAGPALSPSVSRRA
jgi:hypothetical protein